MKKRASNIDQGKADGYWSRIIERAARSFENYIINEMMLRGYDNDYLANVRGFEQWGDKNPTRYPYLKREELPEIKDAFENLFSTIETKETDQGVAMFSRKKPKPVKILSKGYPAKNLNELVAKAKDYARRTFAGETIVNKNDGSEIEITWQGIKHSLTPNASKNEALVAYKLGELIEKAKALPKEADYKRRRNIDAVYPYQIDVVIDGEPVTIRIIVREAEGGKRYYDHTEIKSPAGHSGEGLRQSHQPFTGLPDNSDADNINQKPKNLKSNSTDAFKPALSPDFVTKTASRIAVRIGLARGVKVHTVDTEAMLPAAVREQAAKEGATGEIIAVHHGKSIYIVADRHSTVAQIEESLLHEATHYGAEQLFGKDLSPAYNRLFMKLGGVKKMQALADKLGFGESFAGYVETANKLLNKGAISTKQRNQYLVDEFVALAQGETAYESLPQRIKRAIQEFIGAVRNWLANKKLEGLAKFSDADMAYLLKSLREASAGQQNITKLKPKFMVAWSGKKDRIKRQQFWKEWQNYAQESIEQKDYKQWIEERLALLRRGSVRDEGGKRGYEVIDDKDEFAGFKSDKTIGSRFEINGDQI